MRNLVIAFALLSTTASAQEVVLNDGQRIRWKSIVQTDESLTIRTDEDKIVKVRKATVASITPGKVAVPSVLTGATATFKTKTSQVNLFSRIDPRRDAFTGEWRFASGALTTRTDGKQNARLVVGEPPPEYDLTLVVERLSGKDWFGVVLVGGGRQFMYILGAGGDKFSGPWLLDGQGADQAQGDATKEGKVFERRRARTVTFKVRDAGFVVQLDGKDYHGWSGDWKRLSLAPYHNLPRKGVLALANGADEWRIRRLTMTVPKE